MAAAGADVALSFVRQAADVDELRAVVRDRSRIVAKIETAAALEQLVEITDAAGAVMVARGDLGIDCPLEDVPHLQEADPAPLRRGRYAGRHGHADAGVDDRRPGTDPGRGP